jgi:hypothetical protein
VEDVEKDNPQLHRLIQLGKYAHQQLQAVGHAQGEMVGLANKGCRRQCNSACQCAVSTTFCASVTLSCCVKLMTLYLYRTTASLFARVCTFQRMRMMRESHCCARKRQFGECSGRARAVGYGATILPAAVISVL